MERRFVDQNDSFESYKVADQKDEVTEQKGEVLVGSFLYLVEDTCFI